MDRHADRTIVFVARTAKFVGDLSTLGQLPGDVRPRFTVQRRSKDASMRCTPIPIVIKPTPATLQLIDARNVAIAETKIGDSDQVARGLAFARTSGVSIVPLSKWCFAPGDRGVECDDPRIVYSPGYAEMKLPK